MTRDTFKDKGAPAPNGRREAINQFVHEAWNASNYPGTRQLCCLCDQLTGRCEEDSLYCVDTGPLCMDCYARQEDSP